MHHGKAIYHCFSKEKCIQCAQCYITCPDMVFQFEPGIYKGRKMMVNKGLDYHHCKGCLRCVEICPTQALVSGVEREHSNLKWFIRNKDLIVEHMDYEDVGANSWITSDSFLEVEKITEVKSDGKNKRWYLKVGMNWQLMPLNRLIIM